MFGSEAEQSAHSAAEEEVQRRSATCCGEKVVECCWPACVGIVDPELRRGQFFVGLSSLATLY
jgi:hypothetical protein